MKPKARVNNIPGRFLKDGSDVLTKPVTEICNFSIKSKIFPDSFKLEKLKSVFKKYQEWTPPIADLFH